MATKSFRYNAFSSKAAASTVEYSSRNFPRYLAFIFSTHAPKDGTIVGMNKLQFHNCLTGSATHFTIPEVANWSSMADRNNHENGNLQDVDDNPTSIVG